MQRPSGQIKSVRKQDTIKIIIHKKVCECHCFRRFVGFCLTCEKRERERERERQERGKERETKSVREKEERRISKE